MSRMTALTVRILKAGNLRSMALRFLLAQEPTTRGTGVKKR
jgi:hypothetical protein